MTIRAGRLAAFGVACILGAAGCSGAAEPSTAIPPTTETPTEQPKATVNIDQPAFAPVKLSGRGNKVARFKIPSGTAALAKLTNKGSANFVVWSVGSNGDQNELLVNVIGRYSGTRLFDANQDEHSVALKIESNGSWSATIEPYSNARRWSGASKLTGHGDDVVLLTNPPSGLATASINHHGKSNFVVTAYSASEADLLVNEIGNYSGESQLPDGTILLEIEADGTWSVTMT